MVTNETLKACIRNAIALERAHVGAGELDCFRVGLMVEMQTKICAALLGMDWHGEDTNNARIEAEDMADRLNRESPPNP